MYCEHKRLKSVNCVIMCADCGAVVTQRDSRTGRVKEAAPPGAEGAEPKKRAARRKKEAEKT